MAEKCVENDGKIHLKIGNFSSSKGKVGNRVK